MTEKIGLEAIWSNENFNKGQAEYMSKMLSSQNATGALTGTMNQLGMNTQGVGGIISSLAGSLGISTTGMIALGGAIGIGVVAFKTISAAVSDFIGFMISGEDAAIRVASKVEELNLAAQAMGQQVGLSGTDVNGLVKQLTDMEVSASDANLVIADFARYGLKMADVVKLATVAENASVLSGKSATETFADMAGAIEMLRVRSLKTNGIIFDQADAFQAMADSLGKDKDELTDTEKQQAFLNITIEKGANLAGLHAVAMQTAAEQLDHMSGKALPDLKNALGAPFQAAFFNVVKGFNDIIEAVTKMASEGGSLYPLLIDLGAAFKLLTQPLADFGASLLGLSTGPMSDFSTRIEDFISGAFDWGINLVVNFATGIIDGASTALVGAINYVGQILASWFGPGSPPKVAPNIDVWGAQTMEQYLMGFTEANFDMLKNVQKPMMEVFGSLADMGKMSKEAADEMYVNFSEEMIKAISTGNISQGLLDQLASSGGMYGKELANIVTEQFALATAVKAESDAEKALTDAQKREKTAGAAVNKGLIEYNQMLRGGASKEQLAAKLKEINANKQAQVQAKKDIDASQTKVDLAKENLDLLRQQEAQTEKLLQAMLDLTKAQIDASKVTVAPGAKAGGAKAGGGGGPTIKTPQFDASQITNSMRDAVNKAADEMSLILLSKWLHIKLQIILHWQDMIDNITGAWDKFFSGLPSGVQTALTNMWANGKIIFGDIGQVWNDMVLGNWSKAWEDIKKLAADWWTGFQQSWHDWHQVLADWIGEEWNKIKDDKVIKALTDIYNWIFGHSWVDDMLNGFTTFFTDVGNKWNTFWDEAKQKVTDIWDGIITGIGEKAQAVKDAVTAIFTDPDTGILARFSSWVTDMVQSGKDLIGGLVTGVTAAAQGLIDSVVTAISDAINAGKDFLHIPHSPSGLQLMNLYGQQMMKELSFGIQANVKMPKQSMQNAMMQTLTPAAIPITTGSTNYYQPNISMNNYINNGMQVPQLQSLIVRSVRKGLKV